MPDSPPDPRLSATSSERQPTNWWRVSHSLWLILPLVGCGCLGGVGLFTLGLVARRPSWWGAGIGYFLAGVVSFLMTQNADDSGTILVSVSLLSLGLWAGCLMHCCLLNPSWLRWLWDRERERELGREQIRRSVEAERHRFHTTTFATAYPTLYPLTTPLPAAESGPGTATTGPILLDINTATREQLAALPGFDDSRAASVEERRRALGGFGTTMPFANAAGLTPSEFARVRPLIICGPRPEARHPSLEKGGPDDGEPGAASD